MSKPAWLVVRAWTEFQQYKDRDPTWIKLYRRLLDNYDFTQLSELAQLHLVKIWLLAASSDGRIPNDPAWVGSKISAQSPVDLDGLCQAGWLMEVGVEPPRTEVRTDVRTNLRTEVRSPRALAREEERREEKRRGEKKAAATDRECALLNRFGKFDRGAVSGYLDRTGSHREAWVARLLNYLEGLDMPAGLKATPEGLATACRDDDGDPNPAKFRRFAERAMKDQANPVASTADRDEFASALAKAEAEEHLRAG